MNIEIQADNFDLEQTLLCGQCFRWKKLGDNDFEGIVGDKYLHITQGENKFVLHNVSQNDLDFWNDYFDLKTDYGAIIKTLSADKYLSAACAEKSGIRILKQEPFETLISFIISQNNNIKRISGIIDRLCEEFGTQMEKGYMFPTEKQLEGVLPEDLAPLRAGFRARYIADAVAKVNSGVVALDDIKNMSYEQGKAELLKIVGVGEKVADCVLLFGFYKTEAFPKDVWIKRIMTTFYPDGLPECTKGVEGIAQQYLFDYARNNL